MAELQSSLRLLLRATDEPRSAVQASLTNIPVEPEKGPDRSKRIVAVVSHQDELDHHEEGSVFVIRPKSKHAAPVANPEDLDIERVFPIFGSFSISMAQVRRETFDLAVPNPQRTGWMITISSGVSLDDHEPITLYTDELQGLKGLLSECKRLKELSDAKTVSSSQTYSWLAPYTSHDHAFPLFSSIPTDLRIVHTPLHTRLAQTRPGISDNDPDDLLLIRDEWLKSTVRTRARRGRRRISLRLGTFNVNGNLPSQDLSPWLQGGERFDVSTALEEDTPFPLDDFRASLVLSDKLEREHSDSNLAPRPSSLSTTSSASTRAIPSASRFSVASSSSSFTFSTAAYSTASDPPASPIDISSDPDLFVLGLQELDLSAEALIYSTSTIREDAWCGAIFAGLGEKAEFYEKLASKQLVGMLVVIFVKKAIRSYFSDVQTAAVGSGIMGVMGNKGGTAIRLTFQPPSDDNVRDYGSTVLTFVNAHLAAFDDNYARRNADFHDLSNRLLFDHIPGSEPLSPGQIASSIQKLNIYETDVLFWMGDLNYRINLPDQDIRGLLTSPHWENKWELLQRYDQLGIARREKAAFDLFSEAPIARLPTYRFNPGLLKDDLGYDLKRKPAWTDRILQLHSPLTTRVEQLSYSGHSEITMSDHRPVSADFTVDVELYAQHDCEEIARKVYRKIAGIEHSLQRPSVKLDTLSVDFGDIYFKHPSSRKLTLRNNGRVPCGFRFVPMEGFDFIHPDWLHIEPMAGILLPGDFVDLTLMAYVDNTVAKTLNLSPQNLEHTLILHTLLGQDYFISVSGRYHYTCFCNSLERLTRLPGSIRDLQSHADLLPEERAINAPREIMRLVNWFMNTRQPLDDVFTKHAGQHLVGIIRECLDSGSDFPFPADSNDPNIPIAFGDTLLQFLDSISEPIVPPLTQSRCVLATSRDEAFEILDEVPPAAVNVWISITAFLHFIAQSASEPTIRAEKLASIFAPLLLRDDPTSVYPISPLGRRSFILFFIH